MSDESTAPVLPPPTRLKERLLPWFWYATLIGIVGVLVWIVRDHQWHVVWRSLPFLLEGLGVSWALTLISVGIGMVVGTVLAAARMRGPAGVRHAAVFVIEVVRAIPQLMVIFWVFFTYPAITGGQSLSLGVDRSSRFPVGDCVRLPRRLRPICSVHDDGRRLPRLLLGVVVAGPASRPEVHADVLNREVAGPARLSIPPAHPAA